VCNGSGIAVGACDCEGNPPSTYYDCDGNCLNDSDEDLFCDEIDPCPNDSNNSTVDSDGDEVFDCVDVCEGYDDSVDVDSDGIPDGGFEGIIDGCDLCFGDNASIGSQNGETDDSNADPDEDGVCNDIDVCDYSLDWDYPDALTQEACLAVQVDADGDGTNEGSGVWDAYTYTCIPYT
jgi:hypothetical protein